MPTTFVIDINPVNNPQPGQPKVQFSPDPANAAVNQDIFFRNNDEKEKHWPVPCGVPDLNPDGDKAGWWMDYPISTKLPGEPAPTSQPAIVFGVPTDPAGVQYICALHPDETGTLIVS